MIPKQHFTLAGEAAAFAVRAHDGQVRTGTRFPYVVHPIGVAHILRELYPGDEILEAAGYLHDVVEDTEYSSAHIENRFGPDVSYLVAAVTRRPGWNLQHYANVPDVMRLKAADVLDNVLDTVRGLEKGHDVWPRFRAGRGKIDYWQNVVGMAIDTLGNDGYPTQADDELLRRLDDALDRVITWSKVRP